MEVDVCNFAEDASKKHPFPCPTTYRTALSHYLDITSCLRANTLKELAEYATDEAEKQQLLLMGSNTPEGKVRPFETVLCVCEALLSHKDSTCMCNFKIWVELRP